MVDDIIKAFDATVWEETGDPSSHLVMTCRRFGDISLRVAEVPTLGRFRWSVHIKSDVGRETVDAGYCDEASTARRRAGVVAMNLAQKMGAK